LLQPFIFPAQPRNLGGLWVGLGTTLLGRQGLQSTSAALRTPFVKVRPVQPFPAQQSANLAPLRTGIGFRQDAQLVLSAKPAPFGFRYDFWVGRLDYRG